MAASTIDLMERIRLTLELSDRARRALGIRAARLTISVGQIIEDMLAACASEDLEIADQSIKANPPVKSKRGRKPKGAKE